jgi:putative nucleotidyltransferase with HDIG domain
VKQFYWSLTAIISVDDEELIDRYLDIEEKKLLKRLSVYEQKHSVNVAREVLKRGKEEGISNKSLIKAALLHDVGKGLKKLNPIEKSIIVILDNITKGKLKKLDRVKKVDIYYSHAEKGYELLKTAGKYDERFLYLIRNHHNMDIINDSELDLLIKCDSIN